MRNQIKHALIAMVGIALALGSCHKETTIIPQSTSKLSTLFAQTKVASQTFTVNANNYQQIVGSKGTIIRFYAGSLLHQNGTPVTGNVTVELKEIYSVGDMILSNATTTSNGKRLQSGGEIYLHASQNGEVLRINHSIPLTVEFPTNNPVAGMELFRGQFIANDSLPQDTILNWDTTNVGGQVIQDTVSGVSSGTFYQFQLDSFGWSNCDRFWGSNTGAGTAVRIQSATPYTNHNTAVFLVFNAEHTAAPSDTYDSATHIFGFHSDGNTPLGLSVTVVAISEINGQYFSSIVSTTTSANMLVTLNFQPTTLAAFTAAVNAL